MSTTSMKSPNKRLPRRWRILFSLGMALLIYAVCEATSFSILFFHFGRPDILRFLHDRQSGGVLPDAEPDFYKPIATFAKEEMIHPYFGYVRHQATPQDLWGFGNTLSPLQKKGENRLIVALMGGSLAEELFHQALPDLIEPLRRHPSFQHKEIVPINLAMGGYKQPQQMMVLNYLLASGAEFDVVMNLDGFNELTMPVTENLKGKVSMTFPRSWRIRINPLEPWAVEPILLMKLTRKVREHMQLLFLKFPLTHSYTALALWIFSDDLLYRIFYHYQMQYFRVLPDQALEAIGPFQSFETEDETYRFLADFWKTSSMNMAALSQAHHFSYLHFLQPNLRLDHSKPWSSLEQKFRESVSPYTESVQSGYPYLQVRGRELSEAGVSFFDTTQLFQGVSDTLYSDDCCHLNNQGYKILAREMGRRAVENHARNVNL